MRAVRKTTMPMSINERLTLFRLVESVRDAALPYNPLAAEKAFSTLELLALVNDEAVIRATMNGFLVELGEAVEDLGDELRSHLESRGWTKAEIRQRKRLS